MRVVTWNVAGRVGKQPEQASALAAAGVDIVALQEVTCGDLNTPRREHADGSLLTFARPPTAA
jgi:exonuclease III